MKSNEKALYGVAFGRDGKSLATASEDQVAHVWDVDKRSECLQAAHRNKVYGVAFSPDGTLLATASKDKTARVWSVDCGS